MSEAEQALRAGERGSAVLRGAREHEAAHHLAAVQLKDAQTIRLQLLKDEFQAFLKHAPETGKALDLQLVAGDPPRLWLDLITYVSMEPDPRTYRLWQDRQEGREILAQTTSRQDMLESIKQHGAHQLIRRERALASPARRESGSYSYSLATVFLAWMAGFSFGMLALLVALILLGKLSF